MTAAFICKSRDAVKDAIGLMAELLRDVNVLVPVYTAGKKISPKSDRRENEYDRKDQIKLVVVAFSVIKERDCRDYQGCESE
ncbi:MAG: hypothetical protein ACK4S4_02515 [Pyrinomonadaceae bacterium]